MNDPGCRPKRLGCDIMDEEVFLMRNAANHSEHHKSIALVQT